MQKSPFGIFLHDLLDDASDFLDYSPLGLEPALYLNLIYQTKMTSIANKHIIFQAKSHHIKGLRNPCNFISTISEIPNKIKTTKENKNIFLY